MFTNHDPIKPQSEIERLEELIWVQEWIIDSNYPKGTKGIVLKRKELAADQRQLWNLKKAEFLESIPY